jgi:hypothetical protein
MAGPLRAPRKAEPHFAGYVLVQHEAYLWLAGEDIDWQTRLPLHNAENSGKRDRKKLRTLQEGGSCHIEVDCWSIAQTFRSFFLFFEMR